MTPEDKRALAMIRDLHVYWGTPQYGNIATAHLRAAFNAGLEEAAKELETITFDTITPQEAAMVVRARLSQKEEKT